MDVQTVALNTIQLRPEQIRLQPRYDVRPFSREHSQGEDERIELLARCLEQDGQIDNLLITPAYDLISGHRRRRAALLINERRSAMGRSLFTLRCAIDDTTGDPRRKAITANLHRQNMSPMDIAYLIHQLREEYAWKGSIGTRNLAEWLCMKEQNIQIYERLLTLDKQMQNNVHDGLIAMQSALDIMKVTNTPEQRAQVLVRAGQIQMEAKLDRHMEKYVNGKQTMEETHTQIQAAKNRIQHTAVIRALRELPSSSPSKPNTPAKSPTLALTRAELLAAIMTFDADPYKPSIRAFVRYFAQEFAQGRGTTQELSVLLQAVNLDHPVTSKKSKAIAS